MNTGRCFLFVVGEMGAERETVDVGWKLGNSSNDGWGGCKQFQYDRVT